MATKTIVTRIKNKVDTLAAWQSYTGTLLNGEIVVVRVPTGTTYTNPVTGADEPVVELLMKVGDGSSSFANLPWMSAKASDVYDWAKAATVEFNSTDNKIYFKQADGTAIANVDLSSINAKISANTAAITKLNGSNTTAGSVAKAIKDAIDAIDFTDDKATTDTTTTAKTNFVTKVTQTNGKIAVTKKALAEADLPSISSDKINVTDNSATVTLSSKLSTMDGAIAANTEKLAGHTDDAINTLITNKINALDGTNSGSSGDSKYVSKVVQTNGKVTTTYTSFPTANTSNAGITKLGVTGGAATYDSIYGSDGKGGINKQVETNTSDIASLKTAVTGGVHFIGVVTAKPTTSSVTVNGGSTATTAVAGDVVIWAAEGTEYIYTGSAWEELGDVDRIGAIETKISNMDYTGGDFGTSKFVTKVTETDGVIAATYAQPTSADVKHGTSSTVSAKLDEIDASLANKSDKDHTHSDYVNQKAFSNIKVSKSGGGTSDVTVAADTTTDTVTFVGSNITITGDATNDKVTFSVAKADADGETGIVTLEDSVVNQSTTAATSKAVYTVNVKAEDAQSRAGAIESNYVRFNTTDSKLYVGATGTDEIIFDCGGAN